MYRNKTIKKLFTYSRSMDEKMDLKRLKENLDHNAYSITFKGLRSKE